MYYVGLEGQRSFSSATLRGVGSDAKFVVRKLISYLKMNILDNDINPMTWWGFGYVLKLHNLSQKSKVM